LEDFESFRELAPDEKLIKARTLVDERIASQEARSQTLNILILGEQHICEKFDVHKTLQRLVDHCEDWCTKVVVYTYGFGKERINFTDPKFWVCYGGALDEKTWKEEWA
jgi:TPP-dependent 2-oxoacid decarboxylase